MSKKKIGARLNTMQLLSIRRVGDLVAAGIKAEGTSESSAIRDMMTDLRHYCENSKIDFNERLKASYQVYLEEKKG